MRRKFLSVVLCVCMMLTMAPFAFAAEGDGESNIAVAKIGDTTYTTFDSALDNAKAGDTITLLENVTVHDADETSSRTTIDKSIILDLNGKTIFGPNNMGANNYNFAVLYISADTTIIDSASNGGINTQTNGAYCINVMDGAQLTINAGTYYGGGTAVQVQKGTLIINGGTFNCEPYDNPTYGYKFLINCVDSAYKDGTAKIIIKGGSFINYNPSDSASENPRGNFCAPGYVAVKNDATENPVWTVEDHRVADVNGTGYTTLASAVEAADNKTVTLLKDVTEDVVIPANKTVTLDLNGKKLTNVNNHTIINNGTLIITGTGTVDNVTHQKAALYNKGTVTVNGGTFDRSQENGKTKEDSGNNSWYTIKNVGTMTINDGAIVQTAANDSALGKFSSLVSNGYFNAADYTNNKGIDQPSLTINGGTFRGGLNTIKNDDRANLVIENGSFSNYYQAVVQNHNIAEIKGGTFTAASDATTATYGIYNCGCDAETDTGVLTVSGGTFTGATYAIVDVSSLSSAVNISGGQFAGTKAAIARSTSSNAQISVTGGYFTTNPTAYLAQDKGLVDSDLAGYYKVGDSNVTVDTEVKAGEPSVSVPDNSGLNKTDIETAAKSQATQDSLAKAASSLTSDQNIVGTEEDAKKALEGKVQGEQTVTVVVQPYLEVNVTALSTENNISTMAVNISAFYNVIATTNPDNIELTGNNTNAALLKTAQPMSVSKPVTIKLPLPSNFDTAGDKLSIKHTKENGSVEYYTGSVTTDENNNKFVTFTTNGFSPFVIYAASANVASIGNNVYPSFQAAVDAAQNNDEITLLKGDAVSATMTGSSKTIKVNAGSGVTTSINVTVNGEIKTLDSTTTEVTFTYTHPSSGGPGSSGGSISAPTTYNVNVNAATNGAVAADKKTASKGTMVTVTASPSKGYVVDAVKVVDKDGKDVAVTGKDGKYVFTMPASAVTVTGSFKAETPAPVALPFTDVKSGNWFYDAVKYAYAQGLMTGTSATTFAPNGTMNRAMIVTVLYRLEKSPAVTGASKFTDVPAGQWYSDAVAWAAANNIVNGYDETTFGPMNAVTREQMAAILFRYEQYKGLENVTLEENLNRFPDQNKISAYAIPALQWAVGRKIINGNADGTLDPTGTATRAQVAQIFTNLLNQ